MVLKYIGQYNTDLECFYILSIRYFKRSKLADFLACVHSRICIYSSVDHFSYFLQSSTAIISGVVSARHGVTFAVFQIIFLKSRLSVKAG